MSTILKPTRSPSSTPSTPPPPARSDPPAPMAPGSRQQFDPGPSWKTKEYGDHSQGRKRKRNGLVPVAKEEAQGSGTQTKFREVSPSRPAGGTKDFSSRPFRAGLDEPGVNNTSHPLVMTNPPQRPPIPTTSKPEAFLPFDGKTSKGKVCSSISHTDRALILRSRHLMTT